MNKARILNWWCGLRGHRLSQVEGAWEVLTCRCRKVRLTQQEIERRAELQRLRVQNLRRQVEALQRIQSPGHIPTQHPQEVTNE